MDGYIRGWEVGYVGSFRRFFRDWSRYLFFGILGKFLRFKMFIEDIFCLEVRVFEFF